MKAFRIVWTCVLGLWELLFVLGILATRTGAGAVVGLLLMVTVAVSVVLIWLPEREKTADRRAVDRFLAESGWSRERLIEELGR